jgi:hypothetical protein
MYEGTPLDVPAAVIGLAMSALMNIAIAYYLVPRLGRVSMNARLSGEK